ncbi:hypothetical protein HELRODRAFT_170151 [Helobdella robusta]|uniref:CCHC-type domain-containing protein n=1 Tax=Helobdella robusta TaxID=6412 RepID=T1F2Q1_HELRO|nr:hypothetical protein HELRODRAFT_170151 [Helobdella robusta]ESO07607.1 hypothetical protein HELRODRAFT_170151 [Helobdella robusta]
MSTERLMTKMIKSGRDEAEVRSMSRQEIIDACLASELMRTELLTETSEPPQNVTETERWKFEKELEFKERQAAKELEFKERQAAKEFEFKERQAAREFELKERELELKERLKEELKLKEDEMRLKEDELRLKREEFLLKQKESNSLINRIKKFSDTMKEQLWKMPQNPSELPTFFVHLENAFCSNGVDQDVKSRLLQMCLHDKAKSIITRLTVQQLDDYNTLKEFLLSEFRISPVKLREQFFGTEKIPNETYQLLLSKLKSLWNFYLKSREIGTDFHKLVNLLMADRMKELLPRDCLNFVLSQEQDGWLDCDKLARIADNYAATYVKDNNRSYHRETEQNSFVNTAFTQFDTRQEANPRILDKTKEEAMRKGLCFKCRQPGHLSKNCNNSFKIQRNSVQRRLEVNNSYQYNRNTRDIQWKHFYRRKFVDIAVEGVLPQKALIDGGAEICCIRRDLIEPSKMKVQGKISILGLRGEANVFDTVKLEVLPIINNSPGKTYTVPPTPVLFAVIPDLNEKIIITPNIAEWLDKLEKEIPILIRDHHIASKANESLQNDNADHDEIKLVEVNNDKDDEVTFKDEDDDEDDGMKVNDDNYHDDHDEDCEFIDRTNALINEDGTNDYNEQNNDGDDRFRNKYNCENKNYFNDKNKDDDDEKENLNNDEKIKIDECRDDENRNGGSRDDDEMEYKDTVAMLFNDGSHTKNSMTIDMNNDMKPEIQRIDIVTVHAIDDDDEDVKQKQVLLYCISIFK